MLDVNQLPLFPANPTEYASYKSMAHDEFLCLKAPIVVYMMEKYLGKNNMQKGINKVFVSAISGELTTGLATNYLLKLFKKLSGKDLAGFAQQWIYGNGAPKLVCSCFFHKRKSLVEFKINQDPEHPRYVGNLTIRVHEPEGTFDHVVLVDDTYHKFDLQYHTKYKRLRYKKEEMLAEQEEKDRLESENIDRQRPPPGTEHDEEMNQTDPELVYELRKSIWDKNNEGEELTGSNKSIGWVRVDPELEALCVIEFTQTEYMWAQQLVRDKDVAAQYDAVRAMEKLESAKSSCCLFRVLIDVRTNYLVRMEAAYAMARGYSSRQTEHIGIRQLLLAYRKKYSTLKEPAKSVFDLLPHRNNFRALSEYFVLKAMITAMSLVRDDHGECPREIRKFLMSILLFNDNVRNEFSDNYYVSTLIEAIGTSYMPPSIAAPAKDDTDTSTTTAAQPARTWTLEMRAKDPGFLEALAEVNRFLFLETQTPTYHNVVAKSCLQVFLKWAVAGLVKPAAVMKPFLLFSRPGNFIAVRRVCVDALILFGWVDTTISLYLLSLMTTDPEYQLRCYVAKRMQMVAFSLSDQKLKSATAASDTVVMKRETGDLMVEIEDLSAGLDLQIDELKKAANESNTALKQAVIKNDEFNRALWKFTTTDSLLDKRLNLMTLELCQTLYEPFVVDEPTPPPVMVEIEDIEPELEKLKLMLKLERPEAPPVVIEDESVSPEVVPIPKTPIKIKLFLGSSSSNVATLSEPPVVPKVISVPEKPVEPVNIETTVTPATIPKESKQVHQSKEDAESKPSHTGRGLTQERHDDLSKILEQMRTHPLASSFLTPVDLTLYHDYMSIVQRPMDLSTIRRKLDNWYYGDEEEMYTDIRLIFSNCRAYNFPQSGIYAQADRFEDFFNNLIGVVSAPSPGNAEVFDENAPTLTADEKSSALEIVARLTSQPLSYFFTSAVDPVRDGAPDYFDYVTEPMDLGTVHRKLVKGLYASIAEFESDVEKVFVACYAYNKSPQTAVHQGGKQLENIWNIHWKRTKTSPKKTVPTVDVTGLSRILDDLCANVYAGPFLQPVDWKSLGIPTYPKVIKKPVDFATIRKKLMKGTYKNSKMFHADVFLVFDNCIKFNGADSEIAQWALAMKESAKELLKDNQ